MNSMKRQQGQTLGGMILGILIAVVILGGAFWFFSQQKAPFQPEVVKKETPVPEPEIIVPNDGLESILHKDPSEWLGGEEEPTTPESVPDTKPEQPQIDKPVESTPGTPSKQGGTKPAPDELGAFIEKDLAKKENLVVETKPAVPAKADPKPVEKKPEPDAKPAAEKKPEPEKKADTPPKADKKPIEQPKVAGKQGTLQAGAYRTPEQAEEQKVKLALMGYTANVIKSDLGEKGIMYRVRMGVADTQSAKADLAGKGVDVMVVR